MKKKSGIYLDILSHVLLIGATIVAIFPLVWIIISSVKGKGELTQYPTRFWPEQFTLDYFTHVINDLHFIDNIRNSLIIALATTVIAIIISPMVLFDSSLNWEQSCQDYSSLPTFFHQFC